MHRESSLVETLNSYLKPYFYPRKGFKKERVELIKFALNHITLMFSAKEKIYTQTQVLGEIRHYCLNCFIDSWGALYDALVIPPKFKLPSDKL